MSMPHGAFRAGAAWIIAGAILLSLPLACSCSKKAKDDSLVLREDIYGFFLGQTKEAVFERAKNIARSRRRPSRLSATAASSMISRPRSIRTRRSTGALRVPRRPAHGSDRLLPRHEAPESRLAQDAARGTVSDERGRRGRKARDGAEDLPARRPRHVDHDSPHHEEGCDRALRPVPPRRAAQDGSSRRTKRSRPENSASARARSSSSRRGSPP